MVSASLWHHAKGFTGGEFYELKKADALLASR